MSKVVFPAFSDSNFSPVEMRQFVSALELRFESLETEDTSITENGDDFSPIGHTHVESEIVDLQPYITNLSNESIFDLEDVEGTPSNNDILVYSSSQSSFRSVSPGSGASVALNDLTDVTVPAPDDGDVLTFNSLAGAWEGLGASGGGGGITSLANLTDTDLTGQTLYDMLFNADGSEWRDTDGKLLWNDVSQYMQLANNHSINWLDGIGLTREALALKQSGVASALIHNQEVTLATEITTTSATYVDVPGAFIDQSQLIDGDDYLLIVRCASRNLEDANTETNGVRLVDESEILITGSEQIYESVGGESDVKGFQYTFTDVFTANQTGDQHIQLQQKLGGAGTNHGVSGIFMQAINISQIPNSQQSNGGATVNITGAGVWHSINASVTLIQGDWVIFATGTHNNFTGNASMIMGLSDGVSDLGPFGAKDIPNSTGVFPSSFIHHVSITEATTYTLRAQTNGAVSWDNIFGSLVAIRLDEFNEFHVDHTTGDTTPVDGTEFDLQTLSFNSVTGSNQWMFLGALQQEVAGINDFGQCEVQADIDGLGDVLVAGDQTFFARTETNSFKTGHLYIPGTIRTIGLGQSVEADLKFIPDSSSPTANVINNSMLIAFPLAIGAGLQQRFHAGNELFDTRLLGTRIQTLNGIGHDWLDSDFVTREILNFKGGAGLLGLAPERNFNEDLVQSAGAGSTSYVDLADAVVTGDNFNVGDKYLVVWHTIGVNSSSLNAGNASRLTLNGVELPGSERLFDGGGAGTDDGMANTYVTSFVYTMGDLKVQYHDASIGTMFVNKTRLMTINLTTLGDANFTESISNATVNLDDTGFADTAASITIGDGVSDYMIFAGGRMDNPSNTQCEATISLDIDNATTIEKLLFEEFDDHPQLTAAGMSVALAPAAGTVYKIVGRTTATQGHTADIDHAFVIAIKLNAFDEYHTSSTADATDPVSSGDFDYQESSFTSMVDTGNWAFWSFMVGEMGASSGPTARIQANLNLAGYNDVCFDSVTRQNRANIADQGRLIFPTTDTQIAIGDDVDFKLVMNHNQANDTVEQVHMVAHTWSVAGALVDTTFLGHDSFPTVINGTTISLDAPTDVEGDLTVNAGFDFFSDNLQTKSTGINVQSDFATDITAGEDSTVGIDFLELGGTTVARIGYDNEDDDLELINFIWGPDAGVDAYITDSIGTTGLVYRVSETAGHTFFIASPGNRRNQFVIRPDHTGLDISGSTELNPDTGLPQLLTLDFLNRNHGLQVGQFGWDNSADLSIENLIWGGSINFSAKNDAGAVIDLLQMDPQALTSTFGTDLIVDAGFDFISDNLLTTSRGIDIRQLLDTVITGNNDADGGLRIINATNSTAVAEIGYPSGGSDDIRIQNFINNGSLRVLMRDSTDADNLMFRVNPDTVELSWSDGVGGGAARRLVTNLEGVELRGALGNDPATGGVQDVRLLLQNFNQQNAGSLGYETSTGLRLRNLVQGGSIDFRQTDVNSADRLMARIEDEEVWLAFNELGVGADRRLATKLTGIQINGALANDTGGIGDTLIQYADITGVFVGSLGYLNTIDFDIVNEVLGGKINLTTELAGGGAELSAHTETAALGGLFAHNLLTGAGLERVLTESDISTGGASVTAAYRFDTSIVEADPGNGDFRMDNATPASVTELFISSTTDNNNDFNTLLSLVSVGDQIYIQQDNDSTKFILFDVTANVDNTGWWSIAGTINLSGTIFDSNAKCHILVVFGGSGLHGDVFKVGTPVDNEIGVWTGDGTLEGDPNFLWDGDVFSLTATAELQIASLFHGGNIRISGENLAGTEIDFFTLDPDNLRNLSEVPLYFTGQPAAGGTFFNQGHFWVRDDARTSPMFTDSFGDDVVLAGIDANGFTDRIAVFSGTNTIDGDANFTYGASGNPEQMMIQVVTNTINDVGLLIIDSDSVLNPDGWGLIPGQAGLHDGTLIITSDPADTVNNRVMTLLPSSATTFGFGAAVANNQGFVSETAGALAYFMPIDNTGREETKLSGVGFVGGTGHEGLLSFEVYGYGDSGLQFSRQLQLVLDSDAKIHADFYGQIKMGEFGDAATESGNNAALGYLAADGLQLTGQGTTRDITMYDDTHQVILSSQTGTAAWRFHKRFQVGTYVEFHMNSATDDFEITGAGSCDNILWTGYDGLMNIDSDLEVEGNGVFGPGTGSVTLDIDSGSADFLSGELRFLAGGVEQAFIQWFEFAPNDSLLINSVTGKMQLFTDNTLAMEIATDQSIRYSGTQEWDKGADIASAATLVLGADGNSFDVTGTTTITAISAKPIGTIIVLQFDAVATLTHNATTLILQGDVNMVPAAGDTIGLHSYDGTNWQEIFRNDGQNVRVSGVIADEAMVRGNGGSRRVQDTGNTIGGDDEIVMAGFIQLQTFTDAELNAIANAVNTGGSKVQGATAYNTTQDVPVWAVGAADGDVWVDGAGTTVNTPV